MVGEQSVAARSATRIAFVLCSTCVLLVESLVVSTSLASFTAATATLTVGGSLKAAIAMKTFVTAVLWLIGAILCTAAAVGITAGFWFADREYVHLLDDCVYHHNFTVGGSVIPTFLVSAVLVASGVLVWLVVTMVVNRRATGSYFQITSRWLLACCAFTAIGIASWFAFTEWIGRIVAEAIVNEQFVETLLESAEIEVVDDRQQ